MVLSCHQIKKRIDEYEPEEGGIVVTPILDWEEQAEDGSSSLDVRLGQNFRIPGRTKLDGLNHLSKDHLDDVQKYNEDHHVPVGDYFVLHPGQFVLGETLEWINLPRTLSAYVVGRSSWGRDGLIVATAIGIHPNYSGIITLELTNVGEIPLRLYPGTSVAQLFVHTLDEDTRPPPRTGYSMFHGAVGPSSGDPIGPDKETIRHIRDQ
jgi:dCTP deaminase